MEFPRQEYWGRLPFPPPRDLTKPGIKHAYPESPALVGGFFTTEPPGEPSQYYKALKNELVPSSQMHPSYNPKILD